MIEGWWWWSDQWQDLSNADLQESLAWPTIAPLNSCSWVNTSYNRGCVGHISRPIYLGRCRLYQYNAVQFLKNTEYNMLESMKINRENVIIRNTKYTLWYIFHAQFTRRSRCMGWINIMQVHMAAQLSAHWKDCKEIYVLDETQLGCEINFHCGAFHSLDNTHGQ